MLAASLDGFFILAACYELTLTLCFSCLILILFVANKFLSFMPYGSVALHPPTHGCSILEWHTQPPRDPFQKPISLGNYAEILGQFTD